MSRAKYCIVFAPNLAKPGQPVKAICYTRRTVNTLAMSYRFFLLIFAIIPLAGCTYLPFTNREAAVTCSYNQKTYQVGESFPSVDNCNSCGCSENGEVATH